MNINLQLYILPILFIPDPLSKPGTTNINWDELYSKQHNYCPSTEHASGVLRRQEAALLTAQEAQFDDAVEDDIT